MSDGLSVAEQLYVLVHDQVRGFVLTAALIGAVLGELRLQGRVDLDEDAYVRVLDPTPTGQPMLDVVLARLATEESRTPYAWVLAAGDEVREQVALTVRQRRLADLRATLLEGMRAEVATWLHDGRDNRGALLGRLLWGVEHRRHLTGIDRRALRRASVDDWAALLPRNAWAYHARGFAGIRPTPGRYIPLDRPPSRRWLAPLLCGAGAVLVVVAVLLQLTAGDHAADLRRSGVATTARVVDVHVKPARKSRYMSIETTTLLLEYRYRDFTHLQFLMCAKGCRARGDSVAIWHDPDDPDDFVTEWGDLSLPNSGAAPVWMAGLAGAALLLAAIVVVVKRRMRPPAAGLRRSE